MTHKYLPPNEGGIWQHSAAISFKSKLQRMSGSCANAKKSTMLPGPAGLGAGLGSTMLFRAGDFADAFKSNRPYVYAGRLNYAQNQYCKVWSHISI